MRLDIALKWLTCDSWEVRPVDHNKEKSQGSQPSPERLNTVHASQQGLDAMCLTQRDVKDAGILLDRASHEFLWAWLVALCPSSSKGPYLLLS